MLGATNKVFRFILLAILIVFSIQNLSYGQQGNTLTQEITPISERTPQVRDAIAAAIGVDVDKINETHLKAVTNLDLRNKSITSLKAGDFSGLTALTNLNLYKNQLQSLPVDIFRGLTSLKTLRLGKNVIEPLPITVTLQKVAAGQFKAVTPTGAPFDIILPIIVTNGSITDGATKVTIPQGSVESRVLTVSRPVDMITAVTAEIGTLPECPSGYYGCILFKSGAFPLEVIRTANTAPMFTEGTNTTRTVAQNTGSGIHIGSAVSATDADNDALTFSLGGPDAAAFHIDSTTGQLKTYTALNYETKPIYTVTVTASDGSLTDTITVTIHVDTAPKFLEGEITTRVVMEDTPSGTSLGKPISAIDLSGDPLTYTLGGVDVDAFELNSENYLKTRVPLGYDNRRVYCVTITASDGSLTDTITVVTSVIGANDAFMFPNFVPVSERTPQVRDAIVDALPDVQHAENVTLAHLATITNLNLRNSGISELKSGDFSGMTALTDLNLHNNYLSVLPEGIFKDLTMLRTIRLGSNAAEKASVILYLKQVSDDEFKVVVPTGAPFDMILPITVINGVITNGETPLMIPQGSTESATFGVACPLGRPITPTVVLNTLPELPPGHYGYRLAQSTVHLRTPQVAEAITTAVPGIMDPHYITDIHLAAITTLKLNDKMIASLKAGDFAGMTSLRTLLLGNNGLTKLPKGIFDDLIALEHLSLYGNLLPEVPDKVFYQLRSLMNLDLSRNKFTLLPSINFDRLLKLRSLRLNANKITYFENGTFVGIMELEELRLSDNPVDPLPIMVALEKVGDGQFKAVSPTGVPFNVMLPITVENGSVANGAGTITIWTGETESQPLTVTRTADTIDGVTVDIGTLPNPPAFHTGYVLIKSDGAQLGQLPLVVIESINVPPVFTEGESTDRTVAENTPAGVNIGTAITATDANKDNVLTYSLSGTDAASFDVDEKTGQLKTKAPLDYETKPTYTVIVTVHDENGGSTSITVTINVPDVNEPPVFTEGSSTTRTIAENTNSGVNIGDPVAATDPDGGTLTYSLGGTDAASFDIDEKTGQLKTKAPLDYETKSTYTVIITVQDENGGSTSITVTINVPDVNEPPVFTEGSSTTRTIAENTESGVNIGSPITATDPEGGTFTYTLSGTDADAFSIDSKTGQLKTKVPLDYETKFTYTVTITAADRNGGSASIAVTINITDINEQPVNNAPVFTEGNSATRSIAENTNAGVDIGTPVSATDGDGDTLTYGLSGIDANAFIVDSSTGQLKTSATLDYETKPSYTLTITAADGNGGSASVDVTINITDINEQPINEDPISEEPVNEDPISKPVINNAPVFTEGSSTTRSVAKNAASGVNIGSAVAATDADGDELTYSLGGTHANDFSIDSKTGQLKTNAAFNSETNAAFNSEINADGAVGQVQTRSTLNYQIQTAYTVTITAFDGNGGSASITVRISVSNVNELGGNNVPVFTEGSSTTRSVDENTARGVDIGFPVSATDVDGDTLTYSLGGIDANAFVMDSTEGQLKTSAALDYETKPTYTITITAFDGNEGSASITVTVNVTNVNEVPVFKEGSSTTRSVDENAESRVDIGSAITATDPEGGTVTYSLGGIDANAFIIDSSAGSLKTSAALDYETKSSYTVIIIADDGDGKRASITVTININDINEPKTTPLPNVPNRPPAFPEGSSTTRSIAENSRDGVKIGPPVAAIDPDGDRLTYSLGGTDSHVFSFDIGTAQLKVLEALDYETQSTYSVVVVANDGRVGHSRLMTVTVNVTNVNDNAPVFTESGSITRSIAERTASGTNIGSPVSATDADGDKLSYSLSGIDASSFSINSSTGQLQTKAALDYKKKSIYYVTVQATDSQTQISVSVTINVTEVNSAPVFAEGSSTTRSIAENSRDGVKIGPPVAAIDPDGDIITYSLGGTDSSVFSFDIGTGQLKTLEALDYETQSTYSVVVVANDGRAGHSRLIDVTVNLTNVNDNAPVFTESGSITRSIAERTASGTNIGSPVSATDADGDTLTYSLGGTDAASFSINSSTGQLQTKAALDHGTKSTYSVTVQATDSQTQISVSVTINVTEVNRAPVFAEGSSTTRSIAENTVSGTNIGTPVAATDADGDTLTYSFSSTTFLRLDSNGFLIPISSDTETFSIDSSTGQLQTKAALDHETKASYTLTITADDGKGGSASIDVTMNVTNVNEAPVFTDGSSTTRSIAENTASGTNIGTPVSATDGDGDTLTYSLSGTDAASFSIISSTGQLQTIAAVALNYETKSSYSVTITADDGNGNSASISVTVNITNLNDNTPVFTDGSSTTRSIAENTASGTNIGTPVAATDGDGDTLTYILGGTDVLSFSIDSSTGQLKTKAALDYEKKSSYSIRITVYDGTISDAGEGDGNSASINVTVNVTNVNEAPVFNEGSSATRSIVETALVATDIGSPITAKDPDEGNEPTYSLSGTRSSRFSIDWHTGQLKTSYSFYLFNIGESLTVKVTATDGVLSSSINVTINVVAPSSAPVAQQSPAKTALLANYPNPFNPETWIPYQLSKSANVTLAIYNVKGEMVRQLLLGHKVAGNYLSRSRAIHWDGKNQSGEKVATGVYFYQFTAGDFSATRKMLILK